jgi:hypothetical protein
MRRPSLLPTSPRIVMELLLHLLLLNEMLLATLSVPRVRTWFRLKLIGVKSASLTPPMSLQNPSQMVSDFVSRTDSFFKKISRMFSELLPSPFHSTQRRGKMNQNKIPKSDPIVGQIVDWPILPMLIFCLDSRQNPPSNSQPVQGAPYS